MEKKSDQEKIFHSEAKRLGGKNKHNKGKFLLQSKSNYRPSRVRNPIQIFP
jgi:hypothetical protein